MKQDRDLASLRERDDFRKLLAELETRNDVAHTPWRTAGGIPRASPPVRLIGPMTLAMGGIAQAGSIPWRNFSRSGPPAWTLHTTIGTR
jgi:hypothetical protein